MEKIPVGISSCLLGHNVRYDGGHKRNTYIIDTLGRYFDFQPFCPEVEIGLGIPRTPIYLVKKNNEVRCVDTKNPKKDLTDSLRGYARQQENTYQNLCGYILKSSSPSCGMEKVKIHEGNKVHQEGIGIYAEEMMRIHPLLPVVERLGDSRLQENFIQRVYVLYRWRQMLLEGLSKKRLVSFHDLIKQHCDDQKLNQILERIDKDDIEKTAARYILQLMTILKSELFSLAEFVSIY